MRQFRITNNVIGWGVFIVSAIVYILTLEPTASWWDCSEFIISAFKLEIGHPPGAPIHILLGRFFSLFAKDTTQVAYMVNLLSAFASAGTVMFLYWCIVHFVIKLFPNKQFSRVGQIIIFSSGVTGALAFAFTDSFWFSAVEGEVYALSSFFTALVFWAILKWENEADKPFANRWLIFIAYFVGLSTGVHLLNLLAIPAIALVYYFRKYIFSWKGVVLAFFISIAILSGIQLVIIPGVPSVAFIFDKLFVNTFGFPFNSGMLFFVVLLIVGAIWAISFTRKRKLVVWNTVVTAFAVILIGYSSFTLILIRASANTPMNQNHPDNAFALRRYLNREQYGNRPLLYGQYYCAPVLGGGGKKMYYSRVNNKYEITGITADETYYNAKFNTLFPRMYSTLPHHIDAYKFWGKIEGKPININYRGRNDTIIKPKFSENIRFFLSYQLGHMYLRYFMWNFVGRQNDVPGYGNFMHGNWISGIDFFDRYRVGSVKNMPNFMKNDPARNTYYFLPLILGLIGMFFQYNHSRKGREGFIIILTLFFFTGIAIIIYLNQTPYQPRERDYSYAGSFFAFAMWIGLAVPAIFSALKKWKNSKIWAVVASVMAMMAGPGILISQNWDDHNRSGRYMTRDYAVNYLESCAPNAILFTYGDNDTFPLWYVQEVEGVRTDVKIVNVGYLGMDWYINQQCRTTYEALPVPFSFDRDKYYTGKRDAVIVHDRLKKAVNLKNAMVFMGSEDNNTKVKMTNGKWLDYFPSSQFFLTVDKQKIVKNKIVQGKDEKLIADTIFIEIDKKFITKSDWAVLNIIAENNWERPIYFDNSLLNTGEVFFKDYLQLEGFAYRLVPIHTNMDNRLDKGHINTDILYHNIMNKFVWGNVNDPKVYLDEYNRRTINIMEIREVFARLAEKLIDEGQNEKAEKVIDKLFELLPNEKIPLSYNSFPAAEQYLKTGAVEKGEERIREMAKNSFDMFKYYMSLPNYLAKAAQDQQEREMKFIQNLLVISKKYKLTQVSNDIDKELQDIIKCLSNRCN